jgi:hypothetical protein
LAPRVSLFEEAIELSAGRVHATFARDHEYNRNGTVSLLAGIDVQMIGGPQHPAKSGRRGAGQRWVGVLPFQLMARRRWTISTESFGYGAV